MIFAITLSADWSIEQKVFAENGAGEDYFGKSVSISGDYAIVGSSANTAYLYKKINEDWLEEQIIQPPDSISTIHFGSTVFINGDYLLICDNHDYNYSSGTVFIYHNEDDNWILMDTITASGSPECDQYACSAGITEDGEYIIVGAFSDDDNAESAGAAYLFQRSGPEWIFQSKVMAFDGAVQDLFGYSTFITDDYLFISATNDDDNGESSGSVYIYENNGTNWDYHSKLIASHDTTYDRFGNSISVCEDELIVGTSCNDQGEAYIFKYVNSTWVEESILTASDGFEYDHFGRSVSISGDYIIVGACDVPDVACSASAYIFEREDSNWNEQDKFTIENWGSFGIAVSISGDNAIIGAELDYGVDSNTGAAYLVSYSNTPAVPDGISTYDPIMINNYPNPFNPSTTISFSLNADADINLTIYNTKGQKIKTLADNKFDVGNHSIIWIGNNDADQPVSSGIYLYKLNIDGKTVAINRCLLMK
jgi:hypothetical protein